ncbi:hypothetical protein R1sor_021815 [Riccia sorocarpa]|uniref:Uncharacterized protein n=1 Tax=Riccia sorocarpa TaxID=122646 RepID=A0ABD3GNW7_9MARC
MVSKESHEASRARSEVNHHIRHAWFKWFAENAEHRNTFKLYNTPGTSMGVQRLVEHLCELGRQTYEGRREIAPALPPFDTAVKTRLEVWAESVPYKLMDEYKIWIKTKVFKDWSDASYERMGASHIAGRLRQMKAKLELGMEGVVPYVAKKCDKKPSYSAWVMMHKELASFAETHCAIVRPIACHNIEAEPILVYPY